MGIESIYHKVTGEIQGKESCPTFYLHRRLERPYHIDYIFAAHEYSTRIKKLEVGPFAQWIKNSDHMPLMVEFEVDSE